MLGYPEDVRPDLVRIFRHCRAIPQYDVGSGARFETIDKLQRAYPGLVLAGNIKRGMGMGDRVRPAVRGAGRVSWWVLKKCFPALGRHSASAPKCSNNPCLSPTGT